VTERDSGFGSFVVGVAVGVVLGLLFAPAPGEALRGRLARQLVKAGELARDEVAEGDEPDV